MTTEHLNNLADALENIAHMEYPSDHHDRKNLAEAARILRAAGAADVGGLMAMHDAAVVAEADYILSCGQSSSDDAKARRAALESALRVAMAPKAGFVMVPSSALAWLFGEEGDFEPPADQMLFRGKVPPYWWRSEFRRRAGLAAAQPGAQESAK